MRAGAVNQDKNYHVDNDEADDEDDEADEDDGNDDYDLGPPCHQDCLLPRISLCCLGYVDHGDHLEVVHDGDCDFYGDHDLMVIVLDSQYMGVNPIAVSKLG